MIAHKQYVNARKTFFGHIMRREKLDQLATKKKMSEGKHIRGKQQHNMS